MSKLSSDNVCINKYKTTSVASALVSLTDVAGADATLTSIEQDVVFPLRLAPLSKSEASRYRGLFPELVEDAQYAVIPRAEPADHTAAILSALGVETSTLQGKRRGAPEEVQGL